MIEGNCAVAWGLYSNPKIYSINEVSKKVICASGAKT